MMTKVKLCGLKSEADIAAANILRPDYVGFVFAPHSRRYLAPQKAALLRQQLDKNIIAVGVFVNEKVEAVATLLTEGTIDIAQLHGAENDEYISQLKQLTDKEIIKAFKIENTGDVKLAALSSADYILLDSGGGTGTSFDWNLLQGFARPYFLAGGLDCSNVSEAVCRLRPYAVDVSSGIETDGTKDYEKMTAFVEAVRNIK